MTERGSTWATYSRLQAHVRPYYPTLAVGLVALLVEALAGGIFTDRMTPIINRTFDATRQGVDLFLPLQIVALFVLRGIAGYVTDMAMARAGRGVARDMRVFVLGKYLRLPGARFDSEPVPSMLNRLGSDSDQVATAAVDALKVMLQQAMTVVVMLAVMFWHSWQVTIGILVLAPPLAWVMDRVGRRYRRIGHRIQESGSQLLQLADQSLGNQQDVKIYGAQQVESGRYAAQADDYLRLSLKVESTRSISSALVQLIGSIALAALLLMSAREAAAGRLTAGDFVTLMTSMLAIIPAIKQLTNVQGMLQRGIASADRLFEILDLPEERDTGSRPLDRARGELEFRGVAARYPGQAERALADVSFVARPGTVTAIVGRSGSGKSSLIKLIPRFYDLEAGEILLDGHPIGDYRLVDLRRQVAMVGQQVMLFDGSIAANVAYGELGSAVRDRLHAAIAGANAAEFVDRLPQGADTTIGVRGGRLSGGQRQRLAIARAMLKDAPILVLDEATAALDTESERLVQDALERLMPDRTTLVIAHRLSTIEHADQVLVMDQGRIVERGTHAELLARGGLYAHLHRMQFREAG